MTAPSCDAAAIPAVRSIGGVDVVATDAGHAVALIVTAVAARRGAIFGFCNAHTVNMARARPDFANAIRGATLFNDGVGLDVASRLLHGRRFPENLNGTDLTPRVLAALPAGTHVFLLGSPPGIADLARDTLARRFPSLAFAGARDGFFDEAAEPALAETIRLSDAALVLVGMGHPRQELWAARNVARTGAVLLCIGAFLDFSAGRVARAPAWVRAARLEWIYRLAKEPRRMARRYLLGNASFLFAVLRERSARR